MKTLILTLAIFISSTISIFAQGEANRLSVYPNPVQETLFLHDTTGITSFMVIDQLGKTVRVDTWTSGGITVKLDVTSLPKGTYYILVNAGTSRQSTKKFMKV